MRFSTPMTRIPKENECFYINSLGESFHKSITDVGEYVQVLTNYQAYSKEYIQQSDARHVSRPEYCFPPEIKYLC